MMAGLESYESVYRRNVVRSRETESNFLHTYHGQDVIRPSDVVMHPLGEDNPPSEAGQC